MTSPIQPNKTYGVLHTDSYFSFLGFAKKIGSDEIQKIDVFLDDKLIDTIEANEFIQKIDDMYDVENQAFTYNLPTEYIGKKATISFKNHSSQDELLNSPYTLIDKNHEKFNEASFFNTLNFEFDNEKIQNINPKDSIGFLATEDNLLNKDLIKLINIFLEQNLETRFKAFYFNNEQKKLISEKFNKYLSKIDFIIPKNIYDLASSTSIYIHSSTVNEKPKDTGYYKIWQVLNQIKANMFMINIFEEIDEKEYSKSLKLLDNCKIEFEKSIVSKIFESDERYNEFRFINSINQSISEEIKNIYCPNSIGFLATKENMEDEEFVEYINELIERFPNSKFKAFYTNLQDIKNKKDTLKFIKFISISDIGDVVKDIEIFIFNNYKVISEVKLFVKIRESCKNILAFNSNFSIQNYKSLTMKEVEKYWEAPLAKFINHFEKLGFKESDISKDKSYMKSYSNAIYRKFNLDKPITNLEQNAYEYWNFKTIEYALSNKSFKEFYFNMVLGQIDILNGNNK
ncbi:hypothetical protein Q6A91_06390 [Aliarcobacter skirrowii]|uniref:hypothetical protein n=1 Tax=Aliarcobacter skirrowii TaxID=28200 RepID=UPI0029AB2BD2|nr:hypothetical protein [Aliarcobacter skirrowii]MDX4065652.1 hypothetical protein [Aliarcobacter skirrowii]